MKTVSMHDLKRNVSALVLEAASGAPILITKHGRPVAALTAVGREHTHVGATLDAARLEPLFDRATSGRYLEVLDDGRQEPARTRRQVRGR